MCAAFLILASGAARAAELPSPGGSPYVPVESPVYFALHRLFSMALIDSQTSGLKPWTAAECRRLLNEAQQALDTRSSALSPPLSAYARQLIALAENRLENYAAPSQVRITSVYARAGLIAGQPLADSWHFGQTWTGDYGRPFGQGFNSVTGVTAESQWGRFFASVRAEHQYGSAVPSYGAWGDYLRGRLDGVPMSVKGSPQPTNRGRVLEASFGARLGNVQISAGRQTLWWGPTYDTPLSFSNNAEPTDNVRISTVHPVRLGLFGRSIIARVEVAAGRLAGHQYTSRPWFNAQKLSLRLTRDLEMGFTRWSLFWGDGHPKSLRSLIRNFTSVSSAEPVGMIDPLDPGDRKGGFDFQYRVPGLRRFVTIYTDSYAEDDPSPLASPRRAAIHPGIHLARIPGLGKWDLRVEAPSTAPFDGQSWLVNYYNNQYRTGNTNRGFLLGSWTGRSSRAVQSWATCIICGPFQRIELGFRHLKNVGEFLPGGGTDTRASVSTILRLREDLSLECFLQAQRFWIPVLSGPQRNVSGWAALQWRLPNPAKR
jgi:hypothetical protein